MSHDFGQGAARDPAAPGTASPSRLQFDGHGSRLDLDLPGWRVRVNGDDVELSPTQFRILALLARHAATVVSLDGIHTAIWGQWFGSKDNVAVYIHHIRRALGPCGEMLVTRRGVGYMLRAHRADQDGSAVVPGTLAFLDDLQQDAARRNVVWFVTDRTRVISWVSDTITPLTGWSVDDVVGRLPCSFIHEDEREAFRALFPLEGGPLEVHNQARFLLANGLDAPASFSGRVFTDSNGNRIMGIREMRLSWPNPHADRRGGAGA